MYTRVIIEKVQSSSGKKLVGVKGTPTVPQGSFVVTLAHITKRQTERSVHCYVFYSNSQIEAVAEEVQIAVDSQINSKIQSYQIFEHSIDKRRRKVDDDSHILKVYSLCEISYKVFYFETFAQCRYVAVFCNDLTRFSNSKIMVELRYEEKVIFGVYINRNSVIVDLTGLKFIVLSRVQIDIELYRRFADRVDNSLD